MAVRLLLIELHHLGAARSSTNVRWWRTCAAVTVSAMETHILPGQKQWWATASLRFPLLLAFPPQFPFVHLHVDLETPAEAKMSKCKALYKYGSISDLTIFNSEWSKRIKKETWKLVSPALQRYHLQTLISRYLWLVSSAVCSLFSLAGKAEGHWREGKG